MGKNQKKRIVYLFGAGATQGEISLKDDTIRILMRDIADGMLLKIRAKNITGLLKVANELSNSGVDVEHLITLYESSGISEQVNIASQLKKLFREEIQEKIGKLGHGYTPKLFSALMDMYEIQGFDEELAGILTLNYEDLLEQAIQIVKKGVDYSLRINYSHSRIKYKFSESPLLKLHGSFNWKNEYPITLTDEKKINKEEEILWIPPGVEKRREKYPFSLLWGKAREILDCDVLRIIGCSLSRNDWELISLLYTTQRFSSRNRQYTIELIDYLNQGRDICKKYPYLAMLTIMDIPEFRDALIDSFSSELHGNTPVTNAFEDYISSENTKINIFGEWLRSKGEALKKQGIDIKTKKNIFNDFINEV